ncbi:MAG: c-type cytochrome [Terriglobales bacterium]
MPHSQISQISPIEILKGRAVRLVLLCALVVSVPAILLMAQYSSGSFHADPKRGETIWKSACVACHGADGRGMAETISGFKKPDTFPDFTRCDQTTPETDLAYKDVITSGGPSRAFSQIMPAFGKALTSQEIDDVIAYLRQFCTNPHWARGALNLPRAIVEEKAFPEDEEVLTSATNVSGAPGVEIHEIHEQRFGVHNQIEVDVPLMFQDQDHRWYGGIGDVTFGLKREIFSSLRTGSILALQGEVTAPTGNRFRGFGAGTTSFGTFATFGQLFRTNTFIQTQFGADLPVHTDKSPQSVYWYTAVGQSFAANHGLGRLWSPMTEFLLNRDLTTGATNNWDVLPEVQVTISRRQHVRGDLGLRIPVNNTAGRQKQLMFYLLWDWADGKLTEGW